MDLMPKDLGLGAATPGLPCYNTMAMYGYGYVSMDSLGLDPGRLRSTDFNGNFFAKEGWQNETYFGIIWSPKFLLWAPVDSTTFESKPGNIFWRLYSATRAPLRAARLQKNSPHDSPTRRRRTTHF